MFFKIKIKTALSGGAIDVGMPNFCFELYDWGNKWVVFREFDSNLKNPFFVYCVRRPEDQRLHVVHWIVDKPNPEILLIMLLRFEVLPSPLKCVFLDTAVDSD